MLKIQHITHTLVCMCSEICLYFQFTFYHLQSAMLCFSCIWLLWSMYTRIW